jgi:catechol 2,3-dioxygenase-like lactoylglutathione lyase family enzyme
MEWSRALPVFLVTDVAASIDWYCQIFGFEARLVNPPGDPDPVYAVLYRDGVALHLLRQDEAPFGLTSPVQAQFWVTAGLDEIFRHAEALRVKILERLHGL